MELTLINVNGVPTQVEVTRWIYQPATGATVAVECMDSTGAMHAVKCIDDRRHPHPTRGRLQLDREHKLAV